MTATRRCLIAFDVDNCLMPVNRPATEATRHALVEIEHAGAHLVLASGKPCLYLSGLVRGLGIMGASLIGENGAETWVTSTMPPQRLTVEVGPEERALLDDLAASARRRWGQRVFLQPNSVGVTVFPMDEGLTPHLIAAEIGVTLPPTITRYVHVDSVDWALTRCDKGHALRALADHLGISMRLTVAVGDGANDLPMLREAARGIWLGPPEQVAGMGCETVEGISEALDSLRALLREWARE